MLIRISVDEVQILAYRWHKRAETLTEVLNLALRVRGVEKNHFKNTLKNILKYSTESL